MSRFIKKDEDGFYVFDEREFLKTLPNGLEYFAIDEKSEHIYNLGFNYKEKMDKQIADLEAKLSEKKKEIEQLKKFDDLNKTFFDLFRTAFKEPNNVDDLFNTLKTMQEKQGQDKILFAVEQLEKLLEKTQTLNLTIKSDHYVHQKQVKVVFEDIIMQKISELKGKVEDD